MGILGRSVLQQIVTSSVLGTLLFTFVLFLRNLQEIFQLLVRTSAPINTVLYLLALVLPGALIFSLPIGVLVGTLLALSRLSSDNEVIGMRAAGVSSRRLGTPVMVYALAMMMLTAAMTTWLRPWSTRETYRMVNKLVAEQLTAEIQPRVFDETFPDTILYVGDVVPGLLTQWRNVFLADVRPPGKRGGDTEKPDVPKITVAAAAVATPDVQRNTVQLNMRDVRTMEAGKEDEYFITKQAETGMLLAAKPPAEVKARQFRDMDMGPLWREARQSREAMLEFHQRLALPVACLMLGLVGLPLGISSRKGGRSGAFVLTSVVALAYYTLLISLQGLVYRGRLAAELGAWLPNLILLASGAVAFYRLEIPGDADLVAWVRARGQVLWAALSRRLDQVLHRKPEAVAETGSAAARFSLPVVLSVVDRYVLGRFFSYFGVLLLSFVVMIEIFTFFELIGDIVKNQVPMTKVARYLFFLAPQLVYSVLPLGVLVAVLVTFGVMAKQNEITAFKACGVSLYRLALPVIVASMAISGALFAFDYYVVPPANRIQDALRAEIKGRPLQTTQQPGGPWVFDSEGPVYRIYTYRIFDTTDSVMGRVNVFDLDRRTFHVLRHISAERARWEPGLKKWIFQDGWVRHIADADRSRLEAFRENTATFPELSRPPSYFVKEVKLEKQMNFDELGDYIRDLANSGFSTTRQAVQYHKKFAVPCFALVMALVSIPFAFLTGSRGAMAGVGISLVVAIAYFSVNSLFEQLGNVNQLPPTVAAWSPDVVFSVAGLYLITRMRT